MYIPKHFEEKDPEKLFAFMSKYNFGILVNYSKKKPWATHLPFIILKHGEKIIIRAHMAKSNPQWVNFAGEEVLVIFSEPHSYISPKLYDDKVSVPTWNYVAVHAYGIPRILDTYEEKISIMELSFEHFDPSYKEQWVTLPCDYRDELLDNIVAFEIETIRIEGKYKISQNRTDGDRDRIMNHLRESTDTAKRDIGDIMNGHIYENPKKD